MLLPFAFINPIDPRTARCSLDMPASVSFPLEDLGLAALVSHYLDSSISPPVICASESYSAQDNQGRNIAGAQDVARWIVSDLVMAELKVENAELWTIQENPDLQELNGKMADRAFANGSSKISALDFLLVGRISPKLAKIPVASRKELVHLYRFVDFVCNGAGMKGLGPEFVPKIDLVVEEKNGEKKANEGKKKESADSKQAVVQEDEKKKKKNKSEERKKAAEAAAAQEIGILDIRVGKVVHVENHPVSEDLYVEQIDFGSETRTVVSGIAKFVSRENFLGKLVAVVLNLGEADIKGTISNGLVLCASNEEHTSVEPLEPAVGSKIGEKVFFDGVDVEPEANVNQKKFRKIIKKLHTNESKVAQFDACDFKTSAGLVTVPTLANANVK